MAATLEDPPRQEASDRRVPRPRWRLTSRAVVETVALVLVAAFVLAPVLVLLVEPLGDLGRVWEKLVTLRAMGSTVRNTVLLAVGSVALTLAMATLLAWCTLQLPPGRWMTTASLISLSPLGVPTLAAVVGWVFLFTPEIGYINQMLRATPFFGGTSGPINAYSLPVIIVVTSINLVPIVYLFVLNAMRNVDIALEDAAYVCGARWWRVQTSIVLRGIRPALAYGTIIVLILGLGQFTAPLLLGGGRLRVITTEMFAQVQAIPPDYPFASFLAIPVIGAALVLVLIQRGVVGELRRYATVGKGVSRARKRRRWPFLVVLTFGVLAVIPSTVALLIVAMSPHWSGTVDFSSLEVGNLWRYVNQPAVTKALMNTLRFAAVGVVISMAASLVFGIYLNRAKPARRAALDYIINIPLAVPGLIFGMGIFVAYALGPPNLYGSSVLFIIAYVIAVLPHGVRVVAGGLAQIGEAPQLAARVAGAGPVRSLTAILLPLLRGSIAGSAILAFVIMVQEFSAVAILTTGRTEVLSTRLYLRWEFGGYPEVATLALAMTALSMLGMALILALGGRSALER